MRMVVRRAFAGGLLAAGLGIGSAATGPRALAADLPPQRAERIFAPGRSAASEDGADALVLNPANLGYLPAAELRWTGVRCPDTQKVGCGHAFSLATPLLWGLSTGLRLDYVTPPWTVRFPFDGHDYSWITWGLGLKLSDTLAVGLSLQRSYSTNAYTDGLFGISLAATYRPNSHFGFAVVAHDFNGPSMQRLPPRDLPTLDPSYVFALAFRPTGTRALEIGGELRYLEGSDQVLPKGLIGLDIPGVGRARADIEVAHLVSDTRRAVVGTAGLEISFGGASVGGGILAGNGLGQSTSVGEYATASISGVISPGIPRPSRAVLFRVESTPGPRGHVTFLRRLWSLSERSDVSAVTLVLRAEPAANMAHAEELADAVRVLRARGKKVLCSWEEAGSKSLYVCANADRIVVNPAGGLRYAGLRSQYFYLAGLLDKIGVKAEFVRIGAHKSAPEMFTNSTASDVSRADHEDLLAETEAVFVKNLAQGRHLSPEAVRAATRKGPFVASEARDAHFVDGVAFDDELERATQDLVGHPIRVEKYEEETYAPKAFGPRDRVAIVYIDGDIVDGRSSRIPFVDMKLVGSYSIADTLKAVREDATIRSVVLRIESPGGSSMASDVMWRELTLLAKKKPLIVSMGSIAASGGYYVAAAGRTVYALPLTITGSIGIFYGKADVSPLLHKLGVNVETNTTTPRADADSIFRGFTPEERVELERKIHQYYDTFLDRVATGRHMTKEQVDAVGQGRVWTGQQALERGLVDKMGGIREALDEAREAGGLPADAPIVELPRIEKTLLDTALGLSGIDGRAGSPVMRIDALPVQVKDVARAIAPVAVYTGDVPMARMEWVPLEDVTGTDED
jgi:protease-4